MPSKTKNNITLYSTFHADAKLKVSRSHLKGELEKVAYLKPVSYGTTLKYSLTPFEPKYGCLIEFSKSGIDYHFSFSSPSEFEYSRNLLVFLSLLSYTGAYYETDIGSIYTYLVEALRIVVAASPKVNSANVDALLKKNGELSKSNATLSKNILSLQYKVAHTNSIAKSLSSFVNGAIGNIPRLPNGTYNKSTIASTFGVEIKSVEEALSAMEEGAKNGIGK